MQVFLKAFCILSRAELECKNKKQSMEPINSCAVKKHVQKMGKENVTR